MKLQLPLDIYSRSILLKIISYAPLIDPVQIIIFEKRSPCNVDFQMKLTTAIQYGKHKAVEETSCQLSWSKN